MSWKDILKEASRLERELAMEYAPREMEEGKFEAEGLKEDRELKNNVINKDVDIILEKIKAVGFSGLSKEEQSKLYEASKKMSKDSARD